MNKFRKIMDNMRDPYIEVYFTIFVLSFFVAICISIYWGTDSLSFISAVTGFVSMVVAISAFILAFKIYKEWLKHKKRNEIDDCFSICIDKCFENKRLIHLLNIQLEQNYHSSAIDSTNCIFENDQVILKNLIKLDYYISIKSEDKGLEFFDKAMDLYRQATNRPTDKEDLKLKVKPYRNFINFFEDERKKQDC